MFAYYLETAGIDGLSPFRQNAYVVFSLSKVKKEQAVTEETVLKTSEHHQAIIDPNLDIICGDATPVSNIEGQVFIPSSASNLCSLAAQRESGAGVRSEQNHPPALRYKNTVTESTKRVSAAAVVRRVTYLARLASLSVIILRL